MEREETVTKAVWMWDSETKGGKVWLIKERGEGCFMWKIKDEWSTCSVYVKQCSVYVELEKGVDPRRAIWKLSWEHEGYLIGIEKMKIL